MAWWAWFLVGMFVGGSIGALFMAAVATARSDDD